VKIFSTVRLGGSFFQLFIHFRQCMQACRAVDASLTWNKYMYHISFLGRL